MTNKIKTIARYFFSMLCRLLYSKPSNERFPDNKILIIRIDGIGDYILFRNMLQFLREDAYYANCHITLLCDSAVCDLAKELDNNYVNQFISFNRKQFAKNPLYRNNFLKDLTQTNYTQVIAPAFGRNLFYTDTFVKLIHAKEKITCTGDFTDITFYQKEMSNKWYTKILKSSKDILFEYYRNREFFEKLLKRKYSGLSVPYIDDKNTYKKNLFIISLGASDKLKKWSAFNYAQIAKNLFQKKGMLPVLIGSNADKQDAEQFKKYFINDCIDLVGLLSLPETLDLLKHALLVITNETGVAHLACIAKSENIIVISNVNNLGRFTPYPDCVKNYKLVLHPELAKLNSKTYHSKYPYGSYLKIEEISIETVLSVINNLDMCK